MIHFEKDASPQFWLKLIDPNKLVYSIQTVKHQVIAIARMAYVHYCTWCSYRLQTGEISLQMYLCRDNK